MSIASILSRTSIIARSSSPWIRTSTNVSCIFQNQNQSINGQSLQYKNRSFPLVVHTRTMSTSQELPKFPVPNLQTSLDELKLTAASFAASQEEYTNFCTLVNNFGKSVGPKLYQLLLEKASKTENWLADDWWINKAYLEGRDTIMVWSNPGLICPRIDFPSGKKNTIKYVSNFILGALDFRSFLANGGNPEPGVTGQCMKQYERVFGTTRIPGKEVDSIKFGTLDSNTDLSIVISRRGNFYKVTIPSNVENLSELSKSMENVIEKILSENGEPSKSMNSGIGTLTALPRSKWAESFEKLDSNAVNAIIESQFVVSIDHIDNKKDFMADWSNSMARQILHGDSNNIGNRWFDKTIQLIVVLSNQGNHVLGSGLCYEHTPAEGPPIVRLMEHSMKYLVKSNAGQISGNQNLTSLELEKLSLNPDFVSSGINEAVTFHADLTKSLDLQVLEFKEFGKECIKQFKMSPDSFIQVAINWAYFRLHKCTVACYESASSRAFVGGRTECIRSVTPEFYNFCHNPSVAALKNAVAAHKDTVTRAMSGKGIDRLLLGLNATALEVTSGTWKWSDNVSKGMITKSDLELLQQLYQHELFVRSKYFSISTSQVATMFPDSFMIYGPLTNEGYGCCYNPSKNGITFGISAFNDFAEEPCTTSAIKFKQSLSDALVDMRGMLVSTSAKL